MLWVPVAGLIEGDVDFVVQQVELAIDGIAGGVAGGCGGGVERIWGGVASSWTQPTTSRRVDSSSWAKWACSSFSLPR